MARPTGFSTTAPNHDTSKWPSRRPVNTKTRDAFQDREQPSRQSAPPATALPPRLFSHEPIDRLQILPRQPHRTRRYSPERHADLEVRAHIHLNLSFPGVPFRREQRDRNLPATPMLPPGIQTFPRASQDIRPALTIKAIQRDRRGGDIRLLDPASGGVLPHASRAQITVTLSGLATFGRYRVRRSGREISRLMSRATGQSSYFMPSRLTPNQTAPSRG